MNPIPSQLSTERLILRRFDENDSSDVFEYTSDVSVTRFMDWPTHTSIHTSKEWITQSLLDWDQGKSYAWGVCFKQNSDRIIGSVGCSKVAFKMSFGYVLNRSYWGLGIATEAATCLVDLLSTVSGVRRIWASCDCENIASAKVLEKSGCTRERRLKNWRIRPNLPGAPTRDSYIYAKTVDA